MTPLDADDLALIDRATELVAAHGDGANHTVAAAARSRDGRVVVGLNVYHFTGGPCAEMVALSVAACGGLGELARIVAIGDRERGIMPPCGRCRQVLLDYQPGIRVIMPGPEAVPIGELLPGGWAWTRTGGSQPPRGRSHA